MLADTPCLGITEVVRARIVVVAVLVRAGVLFAQVDTVLLALLLG